MKIWFGYGSEHSMNLVMIGHFKESGDVAKTKRVIEKFKEQVLADEKDGLIQFGHHTQRFTDGMMDALRDANFPTIGPGEVEQFGYDVSITIEKDKIIIKTEEAYVSAFFKLLIAHGAKVEIFSAHYHPDMGYGRGE
jgi:hypothetical protein